MAKNQPLDPGKHYLLNHRVYHLPGVERAYRSVHLGRAETIALLTYRNRFFDKRVLDIGVGTGRTATFLAPLAGQYLGIDYSERMLAAARKAHPEVDMRCMDMQDLSRLDSGSFDFILASSNVIDAIPHANRLRMLGELRRILSADGLVVFSSHNRRWGKARSGPELALSRNPVTQIKNAVNL